MAAIEARALTRRFGDFTAVDSIDLDVEEGRIFGLLGANGAGKSTTIRMLCGLLESTSGNATVAGHDIDEDPEGVKRVIGYMSQEFSLYRDLTVEENITFFGGLYGLSRRRIRERMEWVVEMAGLEHRRSTLTSNLSGGWRQRLALGCAVLHEPRVLFLDEPTGGVDPASRRDFWELINDLADRGVTVLVTTHYLDEAEYCNDVSLMHAGRVVAHGSPNELKEREIAYTMLEVRTDAVTQLVNALSGEEWVVETSIFGRTLHLGTRIDAYDAERRLRELDRGAFADRIEGVSAIVPSLEDVFIRVIQRTATENGEERQ
jgi:ABC-2 type transport system ATP-binding protein